MNKLSKEEVENALAFLKTKGITNATLYTNKDTYYLVDLAELLGAYFTFRTALTDVEGREEERKVECIHDWESNGHYAYCKKCKAILK